MLPLAPPEPWLSFFSLDLMTDFRDEELGDALKGIFDKVGQFLTMILSFFISGAASVGAAGCGFEQSHRIPQCDRRVGCWFLLRL